MGIVFIQFNSYMNLCLLSLVMLQSTTSSKIEFSFALATEFYYLLQLSVQSKA